MSRRLLPGDSRGFTLLETIIAFALLVIAFTTIITTQQNSQIIAGRARNMNILTMLGKNIMTETELLIEGKTFKEVPKEQEGKFEEPYEDYKWKREVKEIEFPDFSVAGASGKEDGDKSVSQNEELMTKLITKFFTEAIREVVVTISFPQGKSDREYKLSTYWIDLEHDFSIQP